MDLEYNDPNYWEYRHYIWRKNANEDEIGRSLILIVIAAAFLALCYFVVPEAPVIIPIIFWIVFFGGVILLLIALVERIRLRRYDKY